MFNFDKAVEMWESGMTHREVWISLNPPIKYKTFERAIIKFKKTGWVTIFKAINNKYRPRQRPEYKTKEEAIELLKQGCRLKDLGPDPIKTSDLIDEVREDGYVVVFVEGKFYICDRVYSVQR